ncbi:hypothetical protein E4U14_000476 [Claviceps sp. LM454 group G7]|nr:hypothetical protein E4U14_000476 [Claviceps sp. LM454 group G7]
MYHVGPDVLVRRSEFGDFDKLSSIILLKRSLRGGICAQVTPWAITIRDAVADSPTRRENSEENSHSHIPTSRLSAETPQTLVHSSLSSDLRQQKDTHVLKTLELQHLESVCETRRVRSPEARCPEEHAVPKIFSSGLSLDGRHTLGYARRYHDVLPKHPRLAPSYLNWELDFLHSAACGGVADYPPNVEAEDVEAEAIQRADKARLMFLSQTEFHSDLPFNQFPPFGMIAARDCALEVQLHASCGGNHGLLL